MKRISLLVLVLIATGCGGSGEPVRFDVGGTVSYEGEPVERGEIRLYNKSGEGPADAGAIKDGKFSLEATAGAKRIEIEAYRPSKVVFDGKPGDEQFLPAKYNTQTELERVLTEDDDSWEFDLKK